MLKSNIWDIVSQTWNPTTWKVESGGSGVQGCFLLHREFGASRVQLEGWEGEKKKRNRKGKEKRRRKGRRMKTKTR